MKTTITVQDGQVRLTLSPETDLERLTVRELGDDVSVSRCHEGLALRPRAKSHNVRRIDDQAVVEAPARQAAS